MTKSVRKHVVASKRVHDKMRRVDGAGAGVD